MIWPVTLFLPFFLSFRCSFKSVDEPLLDVEILRQNLLDMFSLVSLYLDLDKFTRNVWPDTCRCLTQKFYKKKNFF